MVKKRPGETPVEKPIGEVLASSAVNFSGECLDPGQIPAIGVVVTAAAADREIFGVVSSLETDSALPGRSPTRYGLPADELVRRHPELSELITTKFRATVIGYRSADEVVTGTPGRPVPLYTAVRVAEPGDVVALGNDVGLVRLLITSDAGADDGFLLAALSNLAEARGDRTGFLENTCRELSRLLVQDYLRLEYLLSSLNRYYEGDRG